jgi:pantoate--beta-alanine ligase
VQSVYATGERSAARLETIARAHLAERGITEVDYVAIADPATLEPMSHANDGTIVAVAARVGRTRLIDNAILGGS